MPVSFTCIKFCIVYWDTTSTWAVHWDTTSTWADSQEWSCAYYPAHSVFKLLKGTRAMYLAEVVENLPHIWGSCDRLKVQDLWGCKEEKEWYDIWHQQPTWPGFGTRLQASIVPTLTGGTMDNRYSCFIKHKRTCNCSTVLTSNWEQTLEKDYKFTS